MAYVRERGKGKRKRLYLGYLDHRGKWVERASNAKTRTEADRLAHEKEIAEERVRLGLDAALGDGDRTLASLCEWWLDNRCSDTRRGRERGRLGKQVIRTPLGDARVREVTAGAIEERLAAMTKAGASPSYVNGTRTVLHTVFSKARKAGLWRGPNPVADVERRKVPRRIYDTLTAEEAEQLLPHVPNGDEPAHKGETPPGPWRGFFAAAIYAGLRKGECAGLLKVDVDLERGTILVARSYDHETTKGAHADLIPLPPPLRPYLEAAMRSPGPWLFPDAYGKMRTDEADPQKVLRAALARAGLVRGWRHVCRRCKARKMKDPHVEEHQDDGERRCPTCNMILWPVPIRRALRFHDLRHSCATILLRAGVDVHRVQRILRHRDVRLTSQTYAHLDVGDLQGAMDTAWGKPAGEGEGPAAEQARAVAGAPEAASLPATFRQAGEEAEDGPSATSESSQSLRGVLLERETGFEPATLSLGS